MADSVAPEAYLADRGLSRLQQSGPAKGVAMLSDYDGTTAEARRAALAVVKEVAQEEGDRLVDRLLAGEIDKETFLERVTELSSPEVLETRLQQVLHTSATPSAVKDAIADGRPVLKFANVVLAIKGETISEEELETRYRLARREMRRILRDKLGYDL